MNFRTEIAIFGFVITLSAVLISGFLCFLLTYQLYARSGYVLGLVFDTLIRIISGAAIGMGCFLSSV
ncbi:MAG: hypothetical protein PHQ86_04945 [Dehalococcoidales bacterium]|nr:hypothetical protein [Dehalococcoidales bacterium]